VEKLGHFPLPVEVIAFAQPLIAKRITGLGAKVKLREYAYGNPFVTDEGHHILDCQFPLMDDPEALARKLAWMPGIVEHGLFTGMASVVLMATHSGVQEFKRTD
jgi:ribose 5-phosphate isomerase A